MKLVAEYLERAHQFERMAAAERPNSRLKAEFANQAQSYRKLAEKRAKEMEVPTPEDKNSN